MQLVVVATAADAATERLLQAADGVTLVQSDVNLGFSGACHAGASVAKGDYLVLMNDDVVVTPGWLDTLVNAMTARRDIGAAVPRVLYPDGTLQEAGALISRAGWTVQLGHGSPPGSNDYLTQRPVDYGSACAAVVDRDIWDAIGGFSEEYFPGYFEDVEFALGMRHRGKAVLYVPRAVVFHMRYGTPIERPLRSFFYQRNRETFVDKWREQLESFVLQDADDTDGLPRATWQAAGCPRRILVIDDRWPDARLGAGHGRMAAGVRELAGDGCDITFWAASDEGAPDFAALGLQPLRDRLETHLADPHRVYDVVLISRPPNFRKYAKLVRKLQPHAALVYDSEALYHVRLARSSKLASGVLRTTLDRTACRMVIAERRIAPAADTIVAVSEAEARVWRRWGAAHVAVIPPFTGATLTSRSFATRSGMLCGAGWVSGAVSPNGDGLEWCLREILPRLVRRIPGFVLYVLGTPPSELKVPAAVASNVRALGLVDDVHATYDKVRVALVPLRYGSGVKMKTIDAIEHGVPVVATPVGAEGVPVAQGAGLRVCTTAEEFAEVACELYLNRREWSAARWDLERIAERKRSVGGVRWSDAIGHAVTRRTEMLRQGTAGIATPLFATNSP